MRIVVDKYYQIKEKYFYKYGEKFIVFIEVDNFYEVYGCTKNEKQIEICEKILNLKINIKNEFFHSSFPSNKIDYYKEKLYYEGYTAIFVKNNKETIIEICEQKHFDEKSCDLCTILYASCCPELYMNRLCTFE